MAEQRKGIIRDDDVNDIWFTLNDILLKMSGKLQDADKDGKKEAGLLKRDELNAVIKACFFDELYVGSNKDAFHDQLKTMAAKIINESDLYIIGEREAAKFKEVMESLRAQEKLTGDFTDEETRAVVYGARCTVVTGGEKNDYLTDMIHNMAVEVTFSGIRPFITNHLAKNLGITEAKNPDICTDLLQEAMRNTWQCLTLYEFSRGFKLFTYLSNSVKNAVNARFNEILAENQDRKPEEMRHISLVSGAIATLKREDNISKPTIRQIEAVLAQTQTKKDYKLSYDVIAKTLDLMDAQKVSFARDDEGAEIYPEGPSGFDGHVGEVGYDLRYRLTESLLQLHPAAVDIGLLLYRLYILNQVDPDGDEAADTEPERKRQEEADIDYFRRLYKNQYKEITSANAFKNNYLRATDAFTDVLKPPGVAPYIVRISPNEEIIEMTGSLAPDGFDEWMYD